tara:strand:- start:261 stop:554 length:294 start_codon:yes stop_codon:yes gene_type:complete
MDIEKEQFKCMNTFTHDNKFRTSDQPLPDQNKIFKYKNIKNAGKPKQVLEKEIFEFDKQTKPKPQSKTKSKPKVNKKDVFDPNESIGNHNKIKLKNY